MKFNCLVLQIPDGFRIPNLGSRVLDPRFNKNKIEDGGKNFVCDTFFVDINFTKWKLFYF
jgi:hypothetical protein